MQVLITNDDGIYAPGIAALAEAAAALGEVTIVAPVGERSGVAHSITLVQPLRVVEIEKDGAFFGHGVSGAPADCVRLAVRELLPEAPSLVLSGVNAGFNVGFNIFYSGTVAAAMEGALLGIPSVAVSTDHGGGVDFARPARLAVAIAAEVVLCPAGHRKTPPLLNVNVPAAAGAGPAEVQVTRQSRFGGEEGFDKREDPRGRLYYWFSEVANGDTAEDGTDVAALRRGCVSVTPLHYDLTEYDGIEDLQARMTRLRTD